MSLCCILFPLETIFSEVEKDNSDVPWKLRQDAGCRLKETDCTVVVKVF